MTKHYLTFSLRSISTTNKKTSAINKILLFVFAFFFSLNLQAQIDSGVDFDLQGFIDEKISSGETNIVIPPGRYRVNNNGNTHLQFENLKNITIIADKVEMICTETVQAIQIRNCENFKIKGLVVDYDPLPFTQGIITEISSDNKTLKVDLIDGYSSTVKGDKLEIFDSISGELSTYTYYGVSYVVDHENRQVTVTKPSSGSGEKVGDIAVMGSQDTRSIPHTILPDNCTNLVLENVKIYSGTTFAFFETNCSNSQYIGCEVDRRPLEDEIVERAMRRMRSNNADAFHSKHATIGPKYIECIARYMGDDGIAINGDYHIIMASSGNKLIVVGKMGDKPKLYEGNIVELVSYTGERIEDAKITTAIVAGPPLSGEEKAFLQNQYFAGSLSSKMPNADKVYIVTLDRSVDLPMGSLIANANRLGNGFEVRNCTMGPNRSRGILVKASDGVITGNTLTDNWGQAIKLAPEYSWLEAGSSNNVIVSDNTITGCHDAAIAVYANGGNRKTAPAGAHKNITVTGNTISGSSNPAIALTSIKGLTLEDNTIGNPNNSLLLPWYLNSFGRNNDPDRTIYMENVEIDAGLGVLDKPASKPSGISVSNNHFSNQISFKNPHGVDASYTIYNALGKKVFSSTTAKQSVVNTSGWNKGIYILAIDDRTTMKLIKTIIF